MQIIHGDMFQGDLRNRVLVVTTNSTLRGDGSLVMGRGAARQATVAYPGCDRVFGGLIHRIPGKLYGVLVHPSQTNPILAIYQVKHFWGSPASLALIRLSTAALRYYAEDWEDMEVRLNFPGIGNGRLREEEVLPIISDLPDNVTVWKKSLPG